MSDRLQQWRIPTEEELNNFQACCWPTDVQFPHQTLSPSADALELYEENGKKQMVDADDESYSASVYSDYVTQEEAGFKVESPRKKARSVKDKFREMHISDESPTKPTCRALLRKANTTLLEPAQKPTNPSTPSLKPKSLPNPPFTSDAVRTPTRKQSLKNPSITSTPYNRGHTTGRKYLCAHCIDVQLLCCWISFNVQTVQASHLVPRCLEKHKNHQLLGYLRWAIGGRFSVNSRVNYLLRRSSLSGSLTFLTPPPVNQLIHTSFDKQGTIAYPIQPYVLNAVEDYLKWLDSQDGGEPWAKQEELVDYLKFLRSGHPLLVCHLL